MNFYCSILTLLVVLSVVSAFQPIRKPKSPLKKAPKYSAYIVSGFINLPYAEISEEFTLFHDPENKRSRVDYYDGLVKTLQLNGKNPSLVKIAFMTTESVTNQLTCFQINGTAPIQSGMPDLTNFAYLGTTDFEGHVADQWQFVEQDGSKKSTYTYIVDPVTAQPYRYEMMGYDSLFGSHFDRYYIEYKYYSPTQPSPDIFEIPKELTCHGYPGPGDSLKYGTAEHYIQMNPMAEFVNRDMLHHDEMFENFKQHHGRDYETEKEHAVRKSLFAQNVRYIHSINRAGKPYTLAVNHLADRTADEIRVLRGFRRTADSPKPQQFDPSEHNVQGLVDAPDYIDWRLYGAVTPVKDQAVCGSCWTYGTTGTIEGAYFLKTGNLARLSQQELIDCSWGEGNNGCDGGEDFRAYEWIQKHGLSTEEFYGHYLGQDGMCHSNNVTAVARITGYVAVTPNDEKAFKLALAANGPLSVAIDASHKSFSFYSNGIYYEPKCGSGPDDLDHAVLAVGYGKLNGEEYWLVKNSWSTYWGNDGYILMSPKDNNCGVMTAATFVTM